MTPEVFKSSRKDLGLSCDKIAAALGMEGRWRDRTIRAWERGEYKIPAWAALKMEEITKHISP